MKTTRWAVSLDNITFKENEEKLFLRKKFLIWESHYIIRLASHIRIFLSKWLPVKIFFQSVNTPWNTQYSNHMLFAMNEHDNYFSQRRLFKLKRYYITWVEKFSCLGNLSGIICIICFQLYIHKLMVYNFPNWVFERSFFINIDLRHTSFRQNGNLCVKHFVFQWIIASNSCFLCAA